ncbi:uncharacterized protein LOC107223520 isoform X2 [Neodiprion lecontei]|uniref:Uncharacterized protein LOC107223520 isoform X2 n=1 Tax=Neodiprion lecontei TaxID=441921 RepID=A0ABM3FTT1_NEOLC|nr:uncharacterized protein LOC107223520 isoform X2 [Neodiprion lecontei]
MRTPPGGNWISHKIKKTYGPYGTYDQAMGECEHLGENSDSDTEDERNSVLRSTSHEPNVAVENPERVRSPIPASTSPITSINESDDSIRSTPRTQDPVASESNATGVQQLGLSPPMAQSNNQSVGISGSTIFDGSFKLRTVEDVMALEDLITQNDRKAEELEEFFKTLVEETQKDKRKLHQKWTLTYAVQQPLTKIFEDNATTFDPWKKYEGSKKIRGMKIFDVYYKAVLKVRPDTELEKFVTLVKAWLSETAAKQAGSTSRNTVAEN